MNAPNPHDWIEHNRQALLGELAWLREVLERDAPPAAPGTTAPALDLLAERFRLSPFERALVLLCAGAELDPQIPRLCALARGGEGSDQPGFDLALMKLPGAHWNALAPQAPLRRWHLVRLHDPAHLTRSRISLDERILHFLLGSAACDERLAHLLRAPLQIMPLPESHQAVVEHLFHAWSQARGPLPALALHGDDPAGAAAIAARTCEAMGLLPFTLRAADVPAEAEERARLARLIDREHLLGEIALLVDARAGVPSQLAAFLDDLATPLIVLGHAPEAMSRRHLSAEVRKPRSAEQRALWQAALGDSPAVPAALRDLTAHFDFSAADIAAAAGELQAGPVDEPALWEAARRRARGGLEHLARRIDPRAAWDDLVLPPAQRQMLRDMVRQVRHRATVYEDWGFAGRSARGLGICALFAGESGTGKTLAAEVVAGELGLDLYRIDLSAVISKYIGETEKNLERVFTAAETSGAVLLFDEADALFGKRSEVKDSHDRYANIELAYLLQRMESYRGLSILTTNLKAVLDTAFLRRIRFVVQFPFPDVAQRAAIWRRIFPDALPREGIAVERLARLHLAGGNIRNIALNAAFLAAEEGGPLSMAHLARAARLEYAKLEKPLSEAELGGWQ